MICNREKYLAFVRIPTLHHPAISLVTVLYESPSCWHRCKWIYCQSIYVCFATGLGYMFGWI